MSYIPTQWHTGDIVTANKLNNLEQGVVDAHLPEYTSADKGKVLTVGEGSGSETVVIVPEQMVTADGSTPTMLSSVNTELWNSAVAGDTATLTVNGTAETATFTELDSALVCLASTYAVTKADSGDFYLLTSAGIPAPAGDYTVSIEKSISTVEPKWAKKGVIKVAVTHDSESDIYSANYSGPIEGMIFACEDYDNDVVFSPFTLFEHTSFGSTTIRSYAVKIDSDGALTGMAASYRTDIGVLSLYPLGGGD